MKFISDLIARLKPTPKVETPVAMPVKKETASASWAAMFDLPIAQVKFADKDAINAHFGQYNTVLPKERRMTFCSAYGCRTQHKIVIKPEVLLTLRSLYESRVADSVSERAFFVEAISAMEKATMVEAGVVNDRPSIDAMGGGDPEQLDCVDEATNTTSFLLILGTYGMVRFHQIKQPIWKGGLLRWTHYAALITDLKSKVDYAIDSGVSKQGGKPLIIEESRFYV